MQRDTATQNPTSTPGSFVPRSLVILLGAVVLLELVAPFTANFWGVDGPELLRLIGQFSRLFASGVLIPRWSPEAFSGFGAPTFAFYPPAAFYACGLVRVLTGLSDPALQFQITSVLATVASFFAARALVKLLGAD